MRGCAPVHADCSFPRRFGFLAGYRGATREPYSLDLRQFVTWCDRHGLLLFSARRG
jgi:hypothetical protein